jgi:hypothetical protein
VPAKFEVLRGAKDPVDRRNGETTWDSHVGFALYCFGLNYEEIGDKSGVSSRTVCHRADKDGWNEKKAVVLAGRAERLSMDVSKEQQFIRAQECRYARQLFGLAEIMIRRVKVEKPTVRDICQLMLCASRLGRLGSGLPLVPVEIHQTHDLSAELEAALTKAYSEPEPKAIDVSPAQELPPPPTGEITT